MTFLECLEHFRGTKEISELKGLKNFEQFKEKCKEKYVNDNECNNYLKPLDYYIMKYKETTLNKKPRGQKENK